jgi:vitamin B12 transporter
VGQNTATFQTATPDPGRDVAFALTSRNAYLNLNYNQVVGAIRLNAGLSASHQNSQYSIDTLTGDASRVSLGKTVTLESYQARLVAQRVLSPRADLYVGGEVFWYDHTYRFRAESGPQRSQTLRSEYAAFFAENNWMLTGRLSLKSGLRYEYIGQAGEGHLSPRLSLNYSLKAHSKLFLNYGDFYQQQTNDWLLRQADLPTQRATHYIAGYLHETGEQVLRSEVYHKTYDRLARNTYQPVANGSGYVSGLEVFWKDRKTIPELEYWVSYSYIDTRRLQGNIPVSFQPNFVANHVLSVVTKRFISPISTNIGLTYTFASGRTYLNPSRPLAEAYTDRTPAYHNVGLTLAHLAGWLGGNTILAVSINNLLGNEQVFNYQYGQTDPTRRMAITPLARRFYFVGLFINWGVDHRQKTLNDLSL